MHWCVGLVTIAMIGCAKPDPAPSDAPAAVSADVQVTVTSNVPGPLMCGPDSFGLPIDSVWVSLDDNGIESGCTPVFHVTFPLILAGPHSVFARGMSGARETAASMPVDFTVIAGPENDVTIELARIAL